jgi:hypothetical protein
MSTPLRFALFGVALAAIGILLFQSFKVTPSAPSQSSAAAPTVSLANLPPGAMVIPTQLAVALGQGTPATIDPNMTWAPVFEASGSESQKTQTFRVSSGTVKLNYRLDLSAGNQAGLLAVFMIPEGQSTDQGGLPDVIALAGVDDSKILTRPAGNYTLNVQALGGSWTIEVEEPE